MSSINYISSNINIIDYYSRINSNLDTTFYNICNDYSNLNITDLTIYLNYIKLKRIQGNNNDIYINNFINSFCFIVDIKNSFCYSVNIEHSFSLMDNIKHSFC